MWVYPLNKKTTNKTTEVKMVSGITTIRMNMVVKQELNNLKIVPRESYESVVKRLIGYFREDLELSPYTKKLVSQRLESVRKGDVMSTKELHRKLKKEAFDKREEKDGI